jgi:hypothetical protein
MNVDGPQGLLTTIENEWLENSWNLDSLHSFQMSFTEGTGTETEVTGAEGSEQEVDQGPADVSGYSEFVQGLLKDTPDEHRTILEPYIKKWDAGVSRRFSELQGQLKPYKEFGELEQVEQAMQFYRMLEDDNEARKIYESLNEYFNPQKPGGTTPGANGQVPLGDPGEEQEFQELPPAIMQQLQRQEQILQALAQNYLSQQQESQQAEEDRLLEQTLSQLKAEFGEFDEDYVLAKMYNGADPADAVKAYQAMMQQQLAAYQQKQRTPPTLGGGGTVPQESQNLANVPSKDLKNFVAGLLEQSNNGT